MANFLLKTGLFLMAAAGVFIITAFFVFACFSLLILTPGLIVYRLGISSAINSMQRPYDDGIKTIDVTPPADRARSFFKTALRRFRNFLNKYVD